MNISKQLLICAGFCLFVPVLAAAQLVPEFTKSKSPCCLSHEASKLADELEDWNQIGRYHADDVRLENGGPVAGRVVFLGDSITDGWNLTKFFPGKPYVNRGIGGQITTQMLVRMYPDVIRLHPAVLVLLGGTNDIAHNDGPETLQMVEDNIRAICELATAHNIKVVLCLLTPISDYTKKQTGDRPPTDILNLNHWISSYAPDAHAEVADYYSAVVDDKGMLRQEISADGLHPNDKGYELMVPVVEAAIARAMK